MKALVIDDEINVRDGIRLLADWEQCGISEVLEAGNGHDAKVIVEQESPAVIFTDLKMPKMNGIEFMGWLNDKGYPGKVIIVTAHDDYEYMRKAIHFGSHDYLLKPIEADELNDVLQGAVEAWNSEAEEQQGKEDAEMHEEVKRLRLGQLATAACEGLPYDREELADSLPEADRYDVTVMMFYDKHFAEPFVQSLSDELILRKLGNAYTLQTDRNQTLIISRSGSLLEIEEWLARHVDIPYRLVSGDTLSSLTELPLSYQAARNAMENQNFRTFHRLSDLDEARRMQDIVAYVNKHYAEEISLDMLAGRFFLSREHISRRFKQETGMTLTHYVMNLRIGQAQIWLKETADSMYSISLKLGYENEKYFSKLFKKWVGQTPLEYRNSI